MSDISKCNGESNGEKCPLRDTCYRFTAPANKHWQSYGAFKWTYEMVDDKQAAAVCDSYWEDDQEDSKLNPHGN